MDPKLQRCRIFIIEPDIIEHIISYNEEILENATNVVLDDDKAKSYTVFEQDPDLPQNFPRDRSE